MEGGIEQGLVCLSEVELLADRMCDSVFYWYDMEVKANNLMDNPVVTSSSTGLLVIDSVVDEVAKVRSRKDIPVTF